jgi:hypothetical protein
LYKGISFGIYFSGISHECHDLSLKLELGEEIKKKWGGREREGWRCREDKRMLGCAMSVEERRRKG